MPVYKERGGQESPQVFSGKVDNKNSTKARQRCDLTRPNAALSPWRQARRPLRPDEHPCRQGTLLKAISKFASCELAPFAVPVPIFEFRLSRGHRSTPPKICYNDSSGFQVKDMRIAIRFLAILTIAALLAPGVRWASLRAPVEACACPPGACMCACHHRAFGRTPICCMANGGQCGLESHDSYLASLLSTLIYVPTEHPWSNPPATWSLGRDTADLSLLPSHARIPEQPPRATH
jgi:hypothetical protein